MNLKLRLLETSLGGKLVQTKNWLDLVMAQPEQVVVKVNALIARQLIISLSEDGSSFLDIGAHVGSVLSSVHQRNPSVKIYGIEADPSKAELLLKHFPYCTFYQFAVGERAGNSTFFQFEQSGYNSMIGKNSPDAKTITVPVRTVDELLGDTSIDVIKIDIEGAELGALRGAAKLIERCSPTVLFESVLLQENSLGYSPKGIWEFFHDRGYGLYTPDRVAHSADPLTCEMFLDAHQYPRRTNDYFAVHDTKRLFVRDRARKILSVRV